MYSCYEDPWKEEKMNYDQMMHELEAEFQRMRRENIRLKEKLKNFQAMQLQLETLGKQNKQLKKEIGGLRGQLELITGQSVLKI